MLLSDVRKSRARLVGVADAHQSPVQYDPPVDGATLAVWQSALDALFPVSMEVSHFRNVWEPGNAWMVDGMWQVVERFFLYEMFPIWTVSDDAILEELEGPPPRSVNVYDRHRQDVANVTTITQRQWNLYRETDKQYFARPYWVIQGDTGGHKLSYSTTERTLRKFAGLSADAALPGMLDYAPFDQRVVAHLHHLASMRRFRQRLHADRRARTAQMKAQRASMEREARALQLKWIEAEVDMEAARPIRREAVGQNADPRRVDTDFSREWETAKAAFLDTGKLSYTKKP